MRYRCLKIIYPPPPPKKSPSQMFKPNATMITMTADDATMNVISWNHDFFSLSKPILEAFKIINILKIIELMNV